MGAQVCSDFLGWRFWLSSTGGVAGGLHQTTHISADRPNRRDRLASRTRRYVLGDGIGAMSDPRASSGAAFARGAGDPIGNLIAAASNAWAAGLSAMQLMAEQAGAAPLAGGRSDPLSALTALSIGFSTAMAEFVAAGAGQTAGLYSAPTSPAPSTSTSPLPIYSPTTSRCV